MTMLPGNASRSMPTDNTKAYSASLESEYVRIFLRVAFSDGEPFPLSRNQLWVPYGMPRLGSTFERSVIFLYGKNPSTGKILSAPSGSGVVIGLSPDSNHLGWYLTHFYVVTCQHVAPRGASNIRINTTDGDVRLIDTEPDDWQWPEKGDDIAAIDITERLDRLTDLFSPIPDRMLLSKQFIQEVELGVGEDGFMMGLFADLPGDKKNLVAGRFGNLSLLANEGAPVEQGHGFKRPSHIFDMRSRPGFSGSPVFVYRTPYGDLRDGAWYRPPPKVTVYREAPLNDPASAERWRAFVAEGKSNQFIRLLGIHSSQYRDAVKSAKAKSDSGETHDLIREGDILRIPNSMTVVVPAWRILEFLRSNTILREQREKRELMMLEEKRKRPAAEPESADSIVHSSDDHDANPLR